MDATQQEQKPKSLRFAVTLNFILPGAGQFYLGQRLFGIVLASAFLICFGATVAIFLRGYSQYLRLVTSDDIFQSNLLEHLGDVFHTRWLIGLLAASTIVFIIAMAGLAVPSKRSNVNQAP